MRYAFSIALAAIIITTGTTTAETEVSVNRRVYRLEEGTRFPAIDPQLGDILEVVYTVTVPPNTPRGVLVTLSMPGTWIYEPGTATAPDGITVEYSLSDEHFAPYEVRDARSIRWVTTGHVVGEVELSATIKVRPEPSGRLEYTYPTRTTPAYRPPGTTRNSNSTREWGMDCTYYDHGDSWGYRCRSW